MNRLIFCCIFQSSILIFISLLFIDYSAQTIELDQHADNSDFQIIGLPKINLGGINGQNTMLNRRKRSGTLIEYLSERRKNRNWTTILGIQMKKWLNIELTSRDETEQSSRGKFWSENDEKTTRKPQTSKEKSTPEYTPGSEQPIENDTEEPSEGESTTETGKKNRTIVYNNTEFIDLCNDPVFTSADSSLDGREILIFKGDKFYVMENLRYGAGNLVATGLTTEILPKFDSKGFTSMVTIIEGQMRGYNFAFYDSPQMAGWTPVGYTRARHVNEFKKKSLKTLPKGGFQAVLHNRDILDPLIIGLNGELVYYYKTVNNTFTKVKEATNDMSEEKFPSGITAAFSMPNEFIYLFRGQQYCVRELYYEIRKEGVFCDLWMDTKTFLGCYGQYPPPYSMEDDLEDDRILKLNGEERQVEGEGELCDNFNKLSLEMSLDGLSIIAFNGHYYWIIEHFPEKPDIKNKTLAADKWKGFEPSPDDIMIVPEGRYLRGSMFAFKNGKYRQWAPNGKQLEKNKKIEKFKSIIHNSDISNPMAVGFSEKSVYYYSTDTTSLKLIKTVEYNNCEENWPKGITTGLTISTEYIYLFKGDKDLYCIREWKCSDKKTNCCKWLNAKELFQCS